MRSFGRGLVAAALGFYALLVAHDFASYIDRYPYAAVDDSLANISYALATEGRYGFLASPIQAPTLALRHRDFFNYGPWYFALGAMLIWLFGYSLALLRSIHLVVILLAAVAAHLWFGRAVRAPAAAGIFTVALLHCFDVAQWPMVRPDPMVSAFAVALLVSSGLAVLTRRTVYWFAGGLAAACGAFTHLIAWSLVPAGAVVLTAAHAARGDRRGFGRSLVSWIGGTLSAVLMFYAACGFRFREHLATLRGYQGAQTAAAASEHRATYLLVLRTHLRVAFSYLAPRWQIGLAALVAAAALALVISVLRKEHRAYGFAVLLPPLAVLGLYVASLGIYPNYHSGYAILTQVAAFWTAAAAAAFALIALRPRWSRLGAAVSAAVDAAVVAAALLLASGKLASPSARAETARGWVGIASYMDEVLDVVPRGARAWGTVLYGIENPGRIQLVQYGDAASGASAVPADDRDAVAPEYVVWGYPENRNSTLLVLQGIGDAFHPVHDLFPRHRFELVSLVEGPPYGVTRVYARRLVGDPTPSRLPLASSFDAEHAQWRRVLDRAADVRFIPTAAAIIQIGYAADAPVRAADRTLVGTLGEGVYLLRVRLRPGEGGTGGGMLAVAASPAVKQVIGDLGPETDFTPYAAGDSEAFLISRHPGGPIYVSQFDSSPGAGIAGVGAFALQPLGEEAGPGREPSRPLPEFASWVPMRATGVEARPQGAEVLVEGNDSAGGYQLVSPAVAIAPNHRVTVSVPTRIEQGNVCIGVLNETEQLWLVPPDRSGNQFRFESGKNRAMKVVLANCNGSGSARRSRFVVARGSYSEGSDELYTDFLIAGVR